MSGKGKSPLVLDATVLINFANVHRLDLLSETLRTLYCPRRVWEQAVDRSLKGYNVERELGKLEDAGVLVQKQLTTLEYLKIMDEFLKRLHPGEADALALAVINSWSVATDDKPARVVARKRGVKCTGTIGILFTLIKWDVISLEAGAELHQKMCEEGYHSLYKTREMFVKKYKQKIG